MRRSFRASLLIALLATAFAMAGISITRREDSSDASGDKLFRRKRLRCHDLHMATRPVRPEAADSLVLAMRRYDPRWISTEEISFLAQYVRDYHARRNSSIHSQSKRRLP